MGLFAVIGPSRNDHGEPFAVCSRSLSKIRFSSQKRRTSRSRVGKSGTLSTGRYIVINNIISPKSLVCHICCGRITHALNLPLGCRENVACWIECPDLGRLVTDRTRVTINSRGASGLRLSSTLLTHL